MIPEVREGLGDAVEKSGKALTTDPFFMAPLLAQQRTIEMLQAELKALGIEMHDSVTTTTLLDS